MGVEFAQELHAAATANIKSYTGPRVCAEIVSRLGDATEFDFPAEPTLLFLYNPFETAVLKRVFENLHDSLRRHARPVWVAYYVPADVQLPAEAEFLVPMHNEAGFGVYQAGTPT